MVNEQVQNNLGPCYEDYIALLNTYMDMAAKARAVKEHATELLSAFIGREATVSPCCEKKSVAGAVVKVEAVTEAFSSDGPLLTVRGYKKDGNPEAKTVSVPLAELNF